MKAGRIIKRVLLIIAIAHIFYYGNLLFMYYGVDKDFADIEPIGAVHELATGQDLQFKSVLFLHQVNTAERAKAKERDFGGFEIDISTQDDSVVVAHDASEAKRQSSLDTIFGAMAQPSKQLFWLDIKCTLSQKHIDSIIASVSKYNIPLTQMFFEVSEPVVIALLKQNGLLLIYPVFGLADDGGSADKRNEINNKILADIEKYQPYAIVAGAKRYPYLKTYFPNVKKALYYNTIKRPSFRKMFMVKRFMQDPTVDIILMDEYTFLPF